MCVRREVEQCGGKKVGKLIKCRKKGKYNYMEERDVMKEREERKQEEKVREELSVG